MHLQDARLWMLQVKEATVLITKEEIKVGKDGFLIRNWN